MIRNKKVLMAAITTAIMLLIAAGILAGCEQFDAEPKVTEIDMTVDALKMEGLSNEVGSVQIRITGQRREYMFRKDELELQIENFDCFENICQLESDSVVYFPEQGRGCVYFEADHIGREFTETLRLYFTNNFSRLVISSRGNTCYIGSGSGEYTADECVSYFANHSNDWDYVDSQNVDVTLNGVWVDNTGKEGAAERIQLNGYFRDYLFREDSIYLETNKFGNLTHVRSPENSVLRMFPYTDRDLMYGIISLAGYYAKENAINVVNIIFTDEFDRFIIEGRDETLFFVGSVSGKYTAWEIVEYFEEFTDTSITLPEA